MRDERPRLKPADAAVEGDQLLEGTSFVEIGVVEAPDHDVADVLEAIGAEEMPRRMGWCASGSSPSTRPSLR